MALDSLSELDRFNHRGRFPAAWEDVDWGRAFFGDDDIAGVLLALVHSAAHSLFGALDMTVGAGYSEGLEMALVNRLSDEGSYVELTLDGARDSLLRPWPGNSVALGANELSGHKCLVVDSTDVVTGQTWAGSGLVVIRDPTFAAYHQARLSQLHTRVLQEATNGSNAAEP